MSAAETPNGDGGAGDDCAAEAFKRLNEQFYNSCPSRYFEHRLNNLLVAAAADEKFGPRLRAGIDICGDRIEIGDDERIESDLPADTLGRFVTAESVVLLSHLAESTMRLFLAHEGRPPCPWFSISSLEFGDFWREVELRFVKPVREVKLQALVADVTLGAPERYDQFPADQAGWDVAVDRFHDVAPSPGQVADRHQAPLQRCQARIHGDGRSGVLQLDRRRVEYGVPHPQRPKPRVPEARALGERRTGVVAHDEMV